jgi:hypothetical protein
MRLRTAAARQSHFVRQGGQDAADDQPDGQTEGDQGGEVVLKGAYRGLAVEKNREGDEDDEG